MKKVTLVIAMAALVIFAGCKKDKETTGTTLKASIEQHKSGDSKTSIDPSNGAIKWTTGDKIVVNNGTTSSTFTLTGGAGSTTGTFTYNGVYTLGDNNIAVYPETATISANTVSVTLPAEQDYVAERNGSTPMLGTFTDPNDLHFTSLCGALGISLKAKNADVAITAIEVVSKTDEKLNGTFTADATATGNDLKLVKSGTDGTNSVRFNCNDTLTSTEVQNFYFAMPVGTLASGFTLNVYGDGADPIFTKETTSVNPYTISLNVVNQMPTLEVASEPEHEYVDLGLPSGLLWATCNVGANAPEEYGDYFAWGETQTKSNYNWNTYQYCNGSYNTMTKYCNDAGYGYNGYTDNLTVLEASDDAATAQWGSGWRMPTQAEWQELLDNTTNTWTTQNSVNGRLFTAKNGSGNSLFLPAAGNRWYDEFYDAGSYGYYWSSSLDTNGAEHALRFYFISGGTYVYYYGRFGGQSVRAVRSASQN